MSAIKLTKKQKKGLAFRERKAKRRNGPDDELEEDGAVPAADFPVDEANPPDRKIQIAGKVGKKRKREGKEDSPEDSRNDAGHDDGLKGKGKRRKMSKESGEATTNVVPNKTRFILFVGNLKYTTSIEAIQEHFSACDPPPRIRLLTPKPKSPTSASTKSKGCAFLEFSHRNALQQGLKLHGSTLDTRRINVELTAGGGGKGEKRVGKVKARNKKLIEERKSRVQKKAESGDEPDVTLTIPPQRHSTTSGIEGVPQKRRTWTIPENGEESTRGGAKKRGKQGKTRTRDWATGANAIAMG